MSTNTSCGTVEVIPGDELHLTMLMTPMSLNFLTGSDRQDLLAYAKSVWQASRMQALVDAVAWRTEAAKWIRRKANEQETINKQYPRYADSYPSWAGKVRDLNRLANDLEAEQQSPPFGLDTDPPPPADHIGDTTKLVGERDALISKLREKFTHEWGDASLNEAADMLAADAEEIAVYEKSYAELSHAYLQAQQVAVLQGYRMVNEEQMHEIIRDIDQHIQQGRLSEEATLKQHPSRGTGIYTYIGHQMRMLRLILSSSLPATVSHQEPRLNDLNSHHIKQNQMM